MNALPSTRGLRAYYLVSFASIGVFLPFLSPWLAALGVHGFALGWIAAIRPLAGVFAPVLFGWLADRFGLRGRILKFATLGACLPFAWLALVTLLGRIPSLFELWFAIGLSSFFRVPMMTLADVSALEKTTGYGSSRVYGSLGFMLATLGAGAFLDIDAPSPFPIAVALTFLLAFAVAWTLPSRVAANRQPTRSDVWRLLRQPSHSLLLVVIGLWALSHVAYDLCISLHMQALGAKPLETSIGWSIGVAAEIALMAVWDKLKLRGTLDRWLLVGLLAAAVRWLALALVSTFTAVLWLQPLHAFSFAIVWMALMDLTRERAPRHLLATAQGMFSMACAVGATLGMLVFGPVYESFRGRVTFGLAAMVAMAAGMVFAAGPLLLRIDARRVAIEDTA